MIGDGWLQSRVKLGWATDWEKQLLAKLEAEEAHNLEEYLRLSQQIQQERDAERAKQWKAPNWLRPMGCDDYIHNRRMCQERESFEEQRERTMNALLKATGKMKE